MNLRHAQHTGCGSFCFVKTRLLPRSLLINAFLDSGTCLNLFAMISVHVIAASEFSEEDIVLKVDGSFEF